MSVGGAVTGQGHMWGLAWVGVNPQTNVCHIFSIPELLKPDSEPGIQLN